MATIIFDLDGTIADSFDYVAEFLAREAGRWPLTDEQKKALRHLSMSQMVSHMGYGLWRQPFLFIKGRRRMQHSIKQVAVYKGMSEVVKKLYDEGHTLFIVSANSPPSRVGYGLWP
jgi:phosphoserine phosphatase